VIAVIGVAAAAVSHPAARAAQRFLERAGATDPTPVGEGAVAT
jgi:hypothetical protein